MACRISGTGSAPIDISTFFATNFIKFEVLDFHLKASGLHDLADSNPEALYADDTIWTLQKNPVS